MAKNSLGLKLKAIRTSKKLSQEKLAELSGMNEKHISKIETGVYFPTYNTLLKLLKGLELSEADIIFDIKTEKIDYNPFYLKSLQILGNVSSEKEHQYYYELLKQAKKGIDILK